MPNPTTKEPLTEKNGSLAAPQINVFAVHGVEPEVQAYAMAKYSRSALSMKESLKEITQHKAEKFLNTFYFQYGHRSIADLAHIALAIEKLSILAAIAVADEQRWDGQERSTRYQDFRKSGYYLPEFGGDEQARTLYHNTMDGLFDVYEALSQRMYQYLAEITPRPEEMKFEAYERTLKARAFDISRYILPLGTNTSLGEIVNARTLESQVSHLLSHAHREVRHLGELLKNAALSPAYNVNQESLEELVAALFNLDATFRVWAIRYSMSDEEIDVVVANHGKSGFWLSLQSPLILVECKNWTKPVGSPEVRDFAGKLLNHHVLAKIGFLIAGSGFTSAATDAIRRMSRGDSLIVLLTLTDMLSFPAHDQCLADWLEGRIASLV